MGPVGSWGELEAVQGVQVGHRATWFGGGRARLALGLASLSLPRAPGWLLLGGEAVRISAA